MYEIIQMLEEKHVTPTREMTRVSVRCLTCGGETILLEQNVRRANRERRAHCPSCRTVHGMADTRPYRIWKGMVERVTSKKSPDWRNYGGRGIKCASEWLRFEAFWRDMREGYSDDLTLERIDVDGHYCKENCRWASTEEQQANKRNNRRVSWQGREVHLAQLCREAGVSRGAITPYLDQTGNDADAALRLCRQSNYPTGRKSRSLTSSTAARGTDS